MVKRKVARAAAQIGMSVFIVVMAGILHPFLIRYNGNLVWVLAFLVVLGLLMLPGWLFDRGQKPAKPRIVRIHKAIPLPEGGTLFVSNTGIGPVDGFKGFRTTAVYDTQAVSTRPRSAWDVARYVGVLPVSAAVYILVAGLLAEGANHLPLHLSGLAGYALVFAGAALAAVCLGGLTAPRHRLRVAAGLTLLVTVLQVYLVARSALQGTWDASLWPVSLSQIAAALVVVFVFWRAERRAGLREQP